MTRLRQHQLCFFRLRFLLYCTLDYERRASVTCLDFKPLFSFRVYADCITSKHSIYLSKDFLFSSQLFVEILFWSFNWTRTGPIRQYSTAHKARVSRENYVCEAVRWFICIFAEAVFKGLLLPAWWIDLLTLPSLLAKLYHDRKICVERAKYVSWIIVVWSIQVAFNYFCLFQSELSEWSLHVKVYELTTHYAFNAAS